MGKSRRKNEKSSLPIFRVNRRYNMDDQVASQFNSGIESLAIRTENLFYIIDSEIPKNNSTIRIRMAKHKLVDALNRLSTIGAIDVQDI
jgi:hypothetical protein